MGSFEQIKFAMKKLILLLLIGNLSIVSIFAQAPTNDNCSGATNLTVNADNLCATIVTGTTEGATQSQAGCNFSLADDDVWYKFTATATSHKIQVASNSGTLQNPVFEVFSGDCNALTSLACVNNKSTFYDTEKTIIASLTIGNEYFIRVYSGGNSAFSRGTFTICVGVPVPPANDNCAGAITLLINQNQTCAITNAGNSEEATLSLAGCSPGSHADDDVWYEFTATSTVHKISLTAGTINSPVLELFSGSCGSLNSIYCKPAFTNAFTIGELTVGQKYFIRVYSYYLGSSQSGTFSICINEGTGMPANDACSGAIGLTANNASCSAISSGTLVNASGPMNTSCVGDPIQNDVWYKFTANASEMIIKLKNHSLSSPLLELFSGTCGGLIAIKCGDGDFLSAEGLNIGQEYFVRVWNRYEVQSGAGNFDICLSTTSLNDLQSNAESVSINTNLNCTLKTSGDNSFALGPNVEASCNTNNNGLWYKFTATNDSLDITLNAIGLSSPTMDFFQNNGGTLTFLATHSSKLIRTDLVLGQEYYLLVYSCGYTPASRGSFEICIKNVPPPPLNDNCTSAVTISVNNNLSCSLTTLGTTLNALGGSSACTGEVDDDVWYKFVATNAKHSISVTPGTIQDAVFQVFEGTCESLSDLICINNTSDANIENGKVGDLVVGDTYYVRVFSSDAGSGQGTCDICINLPIPNEDCEDAILLTPGATCTAVNGSTAGVTTDRYDNCDFYKYGVYYKFTAAGGSQIIRLTRGTIQNVYIDVLQNNCGSINRVTSCSSSSNAAVVDKVVSGLTAGTEYLIWINTEEISEEGSFDICVLNTVPPTNDECAAATALTVNAGNVPLVKTMGSTQFASQSLVGCSGNADDDVWYSFTATQTSHRVFLQKLNLYENIILQVFSGSCGSIVSKQCISAGFDDTKNSSALLSALNIGETYFIRVYYQSTTPGDFSIAITSKPLNDDCATAITVNPSLQDDFGGAVAGSSFDGSLLFSNNYFGAAFTDDDVWYKFTATQKVHKIKLKGWKSNLGAIEVKSTCETLLFLNCSPSFLPQCNSGSMSQDTLILTLDTFIPGQTYFFRVYSNHSTANQSLFDVAVTSPYVLPNDDCIGALNIPVNSTATCSTPTIISTKGFSTISDQSGTCSSGGVSGSPEKDVYLKFTATASQHRISVSLGQGGAINYQLFSGMCGALVPMGCSADYDSLSNVGNLTIGETYYIRVMIFYNNIETIKVCISTPVFAINDECATATTIMPSGDAGGCTVSLGNLANSSQTQYSDCGATGNSTKKIMRDVWYKFEATAASHRIWFANTSILKPISGGTGFEPKNIKFEVFSGSCASKTLLGCSGIISSQEEKVFTNLTIGQTYLIRVSSFEAGDIDFQFCIKNVNPPANQECLSATSLTVFTNWSSTNYTEGTTNDAIKSTGANTCGQANSYNAWYKFTATNTNQTVAFRNYSVQKAITGLTVAVYSGNCNSLVHVACKSGSFTDLSEDFLNLTSLTIGQEYFVKVYSSTAEIANQGGLEIQILNLSVPSNDNCSTPRAVNVQNSSTSYTSVLTETVFTTASSEAIGCSVTGTPDDDVWYSFTPTQNSVRLLLSANFKNAVYVLYTGACGSLASVVCGSAAANEYALNRILTNLTPNTPYLLRVYSSSNVLRGRVFVALTSDTTPPINDLCADAVELIPSANNTPVFTEGTTLNAKNDNSICFAGNEVWYKFKATTTTHKIIFDGFIKDPAIIMFTGSCASLSFVPSTCFSGTHNISFTKSGLVINTVYYIKLAAQVDLLENQGKFKIAIITPSVPANDNCANSTSLVVNNPPQYFSATLATNELATSGCGFNTKDVWFKFIASKSKMGIEVENMNTNAILGFYKGTCPSPSLIKCSYSETGNQYINRVNTLTFDDLIVGDEYLINVAALTNTSFLEFKIKVFEILEINTNTLFENSCITTNLVSNPSFENPQTCPTSFVPTPSAPGQWLSPNIGWTIPTTGSSDYFNTCAEFNATIETPRNTTFGIQTPRNGQAYAGFFAGGSDYREYLHTKLISPMVVGKRYLLSMYVSRADYYGTASNNIGFGLAVNDKIEFSNDSMQVDRIALPTNNTVIHENDNWVNIVAEINADQAYQHLYLGNFRSQSNTLHQLSVDITGAANGGYGGQSPSNNSYYFVDDIFVGEINNTIACGANDCNSLIVLSSPNDDVLGGSINKKTNLEINANIIIQGNSNVLFQSGKSILMDANQGVFEVKIGSVFKAEIGNCANE